MTNDLGNTAIRELTADELSAVSGGKVCAYEAGGKCYVYRDLNLYEMFTNHINGMFYGAGQPMPFAVPGAGDPPMVEW